MSILYSRESDGTLNVLVSGKLARDPELKESAKGDRLKFSVCYGKSKFMECETWANSGAGEMAGLLEKGDHITAMGTHRTWEYNGKSYSSLSVDMILPMVLPGSGAAPANETGEGSSLVSELEDVEGELPF